MKVEIPAYIQECPVCQVKKDYYFLRVCPDCRYEGGEDAHDEPRNF